MTQIHDVIAAFADGERVAPEALQRALSDPDGRAYLVDLLVLRDLVDVTAIARPTEVPLRAGARPRARAWVGIAAGLVAAALAGYGIGQQTRSVSEAPRVSEVAIVAPPAPSGPAGPVVAPPPTRVITLQPGVDWQEHIGG
jgi:hypothetical protein